MRAAIQGQPYQVPPAQRTRHCCIRNAHPRTAEEVELIKLIPPFHQRVYAMGLEHVGLVAGPDLEHFVNQFLEVLTGRQLQGRSCRPAYRLFEDYKHMKFYERSLKEECVREGARFEVFSHAAWKPAKPDAGPYELGSPASEAQRPVALVTGAGGNLGTAVAQAFAAAGHDLVLHHRGNSAAVLNDVGHRAGAVGARARTVHADLTDVADIRRMFASLGDLQLDVLVNCAGMYPRLTSLPRQQRIG